MSNNVGMETIERIDRIREAVNQLGFRMGKAPIAFYDHSSESIALYPKDECLPIYSRDAYVFVGNLSDLEQWLKGVEWARSYDSYLGAMSEKRRQQYEAKEVARQERIKYNKAKAETFKTLKEEHV